MIESQLRALFEQMATSDAPPSRVDTGLAHRRGRARLRWRRAGIGAAPLLAAIAVVLVLAGVASPGGGRPAIGVQAGPAIAPREFNPLSPYPSFGWLPAGVSLTIAETGRTEMDLGAGSRMQWILAVYSAGRCHRLRSPRVGGRAVLKCITNPQLSWSAPIIGKAAPVHGHPAFWTRQNLVWQYARDGWATLTGPGKNDMLRIARGVRYGTARRPGLFAAQLTNVPARWRAGSVAYVPMNGVMLAEEYEITRSADDAFIGSGVHLTDLPAITAVPAKPNIRCTARARTRVIDGYRVVISSYPDFQGKPYTQLCAIPDGMEVVVRQAGRHPALSVASIFAHHLRLLGANPANWATRPIG